MPRRKPKLITVDGVEVKINKAYVYSMETIAKLVGISVWGMYKQIKRNGLDLKNLEEVLFFILSRNKNIRDKFLRRLLDL